MSDAPMSCLGADTRSVLRDALGLEGSAIDRLCASGVIGIVAAAGRDHAAARIEET